MSVSLKPVRIDGRRQRSERTRQLIIDAYLRLVRRNWKMQTAIQIAEEAHCSPRSVFEGFHDLDRLTLATADFTIGPGEAEAAPEVAGDKETRIRSHLAIRAWT